MRSPEVVVLDVCAKCNLRCRYCIFFGDDNASGHDDLSTGEWVKFIEEAGREQVFEIRFRGGEPLMREDFSELVDAVAANRMRFQIQTNGLNLSEELVRKFRDSRRCNLVRLSLDGDRRVNDAARGSGSHDRVLEAIGLLRQAGLPFQVTAAIHRRNVADLASSTHYLLDTLAIEHLTFSGVIECADPGYQLDDAAFAAAIETLGSIEPAFAARLPSAGMIQVLRQWRILRDGGAVEPHAFGSCPRFHTTLAVRTDGVFMPCTMMAGTELGRINRDSLADVWRNSTRLDKLRCFSDSPDAWRECAGCRWKNACRGSCPACRADGRDRAGRPSRFCFRNYAEHGGDMACL